MLQKRIFNKLLKQEQNIIINKFIQLYEIDKLGTTEIQEQMNIDGHLYSYFENNFVKKRTPNERQEIYKAVMLRRYGVTNSFQLNKTKERIKQTNIERYGVENPFQSEEVKEKIKQTNLKRYGTESASKSTIIKEKIKQTNLEKYGVEWSSQREDVKFAQKETWNKKTPDELNDILIKRTRTLRHKYGVDNIYQLDKYRQKCHSPESMQKIHETKKKNGTYGKSKLEALVYIKLCETFGKNYVEKQLYINGFDYDFKVHDLLLEIHGTYWHNKRPFIECKEHIAEYEMLFNKGGQYRSIAKKWRYTDVAKLKYCKDNDIPYLALYIDDIKQLNIELIKKKVKIK